MTLDILRKTGGWCVELQLPLKDARGKEINAIEIKKLRADHFIRWSEGHYISILSLLAELCDVPENLLREMAVDDFDRVMLAFYNCVPATIRKDFEQGARPLATPEEEVKSQPDWVPPPDQLDPRFPKVEGPVQRMAPAVQKPAEPVESGGLNLDPPVDVRRVG